MLPMYCNLSKNHTFPLAIRVTSNPPKCFKPFHISKTQSLPFGSSAKPLKNPITMSLSSFSHGFGHKTLEKSNLVKPFCLLLECHQISNFVKCESFASGFRVNGVRRNYSVTRARNFSSSYSRQDVEGSSNAVKPGKSFPWLAANKGNEAKSSEKAPAMKSTRSSWEESAEKFLKNGTPTVKNRESRITENPRKSYYVKKSETPKGEEEEREGEDDIGDRPRWYKTDNRLDRDANEKPGFNRPEYQKWNKQDNWGKKTWKEATESTVPKMVGEGIYGVGPVLAALSAARREFYVLYVQEGLDLSGSNRKKKDKKGFERVLRIAEKIGLSKKEVSKHDLNMIADNRPHQGLVLDASPLEMVGMKELDPVSTEGEKGPLWVALDEVTDPQNLGAIVRSAYFFGASGIVLCAKNSAPLSGVVSKASAGSLELMELRSCKNMMQFLVTSAENGWRVLGGSVSSRAVPLNKIKPGEPTILVLGSEGTGLRPLVERSCSQLIRISGNIPVDARAGFEEVETVETDRGCSSEEFRSFMAVESLNVSVAAGVLLHHLIGSNDNDSAHLSNVQTEVSE